MYQRLCSPLQSHSFFLFGPRGTGKTFLLREIFPPEEVLWIDFLNEREALQFTRNPGEIKARIDSFQKERKSPPSFVVVDEVQRVPLLLNEVHRLMEDRSYSPRLKFALTGSSARKLRRGSANLLGGRALLNRLHPLSYRELGTSFDLTQALHWGTLPKIASASSSLEKSELLQAYYSVYLKEEIKEEQIVRKLDPFVRFLEVAAQSNGQILNYARIARDCQVDEKAVQRYFQILEDTLLGFFLEAFHRSIRKRQSKQSKFYFFDPGVKKAVDNTLAAPLTPRSYGYGQAFEHFIVLECLRLNDYLRKNYRFSYFRSSEGVEVDLVIERPGKPLALVEIKSSEHPDPVEVAQFARLRPDFGKAEAFILCRADRGSLRDSVHVLPWQKGLEILF